MRTVVQHGGPAVDLTPVTPSRAARRCSACSGPLQAQGPRPLRTAGHEGAPDGALVLEMFWCPHCGKVEWYSTR